MVPIYNETQPCALYCQPINKSSNIPIKFQSKVIDGTPCHQGVFFWIILDYVKFLDIITVCFILFIYTVL